MTDLSGASSWGFTGDWLSDGPKLIVPVPAGSRVDASLVRRVIEGCRATGTDGVLALTGGPGGPDGPGACGRNRRTVSPDRAVAALAGIGPPALLASSDRQGAVLFSGPGSALVAGTPRFLGGAVPEGVDGGRARFARYARTVAHRWPELRSLARSLPPRHLAWSRARDVPAGTGAARQLELMRGFIAGSVNAPHFARGWQTARRTSHDNGERLREPLLTAFDQVFSLLEDYSVDLDLKDADDLSDQELVDAVREIMEYSEGF
uniref:Colicin immunity domain-containing protein n=1 Tax=Streptomyces sp. NBC_00008 TaxID=2903610 RepID=A0AAU2VTK7_9ACTN